MDKKDYYAELKKDIDQRFSKLVGKGFDRFLALSDEIKKDIRELQVKLAEIEKREKEAIEEENKKNEQEPKTTEEPAK